jgi:chemotaxis protein MotB
LKRQGKAVGEGKPKVPAYIVTFSDMVTLLLTFFVMLLTLARVNDAQMFNTGRNSFLESMANFGLGVLSGKKPTPDFGKVKLKFFIVNPDKGFGGRTIDAREENVRRIFQRISRSMTTVRSKIAAGKNNFAVTDIRFPPGDAALNEEAKKFLRKFCLDLQQGSSSLGVKLYVLGLAGDEASEKQQWIVSARRAQAVADFLYESLPSDSKWPIYSWGAGPGGDWVRQDSPISKESQILIGVLRAKD